MTWPGARWSASAPTARSSPGTSTGIHGGSARGTRSRNEDAPALSLPGPLAPSAGRPTRMGQREPRRHCPTKPCREQSLKAPRSTTLGADRVGSLEVKGNKITQEGRVSRALVSQDGAGRPEGEGSPVRGPEGVSRGCSGDTSDAGGPGRGREQGGPARWVGDPRSSALTARPPWRWWGEGTQADSESRRVSLLARPLSTAPWRQTASRVRPGAQGTSWWWK